MRILLLLIGLCLNSCWFINHYDKEEAIENINILYSENKDGINDIYNKLVNIQLQDCERYLVGTGRGIDFFKIDKFKLDTLNGVLRFETDKLNIEDANGQQFEVQSKLPKETFFRITYVQNIGVFFHLNDAQSSRFVDNEYNNLFLVKFTSIDNFCELNIDLCENVNFQTDRQYLVPLEDGWYIFESYGVYSPEDYLACRRL